jgi:hypothetical protein
MSWPSSPKKKERLFCALMYQDTCQKKKRKQISSMRKEGTSAKQARRQQNKRGNQSNDLLGKSWPCDSKGIRAIFAHEYVIFYRRENYLIEGKPSLINRALITLILFIQKF